MAADKKVIVNGSANATQISGQLLPGSTPVQGQGEAVAAKTWKEQALRLRKEAHVFYFVFKHPGARWYTRLVAACVAGYLLSPIQIIPNYIPVIGMLDDLLVVFLGVKLLQKIIPADVLSECRGLADAAEARRKAEIRSRASIAVSVVIGMAWIFAALVGSALMAAYFRR
ncbi:MAG: YkvA family protein [Terriglobales bacterium]